MWKEQFKSAIFYVWYRSVHQESKKTKKTDHSSSVVISYLSDAYYKKKRDCSWYLHVVYKCKYSVPPQCIKEIQCDWLRFCLINCRLFSLAYLGNQMRLMDILFDKLWKSFLSSSNWVWISNLCKSVLKHGPGEMDVMPAFCDTQPPLHLMY